MALGRLLGWVEAHREKAVELAHRRDESVRGRGAAETAAAAAAAALEACVEERRRRVRDAHGELAALHNKVGDDSDEQDEGLNRRHCKGRG